MDTRNTPPYVEKQDYSTLILKFQIPSPSLPFLVQSWVYRTSVSDRV